MYVSEEVEDCLSIFDEEGTFLRCFGKKGSGKGEFKGPHGITTDTIGNLYVCDSYNNRIDRRRRRSSPSEFRLLRLTKC